MAREECSQDNFQSANSAENNTEYAKALQAALKLITRAEQCSRGLANKLAKKKYNTSIINSVLERLKEQDLLNDLRYAGLWLKFQLRKGNKSPYLLIMRLKARGLDRETIETALSANLTPEIEYALLLRCINKYASGAKGEYKNNSNLRNYLKMQGFSAEIINEYFENKS